ncbi:zinc-binding dehydrogenase [Sphingobacterium sp. PCS056]|uniref:zinc-binding dehydrogenase n=1 Tax=Sphingobacterium sp. PCS056 TaxID=2931400 RepID=UPI00200F7283|nr:zinc-binding dehydrogenase [Sphingobacterium sp. PCS056]UPZ34762.1 zinc-binding dehydrogenase [Sphingobacterium sp. PCS056]
MAIQGNFFVFEKPHQLLRAVSSKIPTLEDGEILVKINYATLCGSDLHTFCGLRQEPCPTILGHEIVGTIIELNANSLLNDATGKQLAIGDTITWTVFASDPHTAVYNPDTPQKNDYLYKYGHRQITEQDTFHGGLASHIILRRHTYIRILPKELPAPIAATINCAIATAAGAIRLAGKIKGKRVLISGMGLLGLVCTAMCKESGASQIVVTDIDDMRLTLAKRFGATEIFNSKMDQPTDLTNTADGVDCFIDMSGSTEAMETGVAQLGINGTAVFIGAVFNQRKLQLDAEQMIRRILTIRGLHNYNYDDFSEAVDFINENWQKYPFLDLIEKEFSLDQVNEAFDYAVVNKPIRVGINMDLR